MRGMGQRITRARAQKRGGASACAGTDARGSRHIRERTFPHPNSQTHSITLLVRACMRIHVDFSVGACTSINMFCSCPKLFSLSPTLSRTNTLSYFDGFGIEYFASIQPRHFLRYGLFFCVWMNVFSAQLHTNSTTFTKIHKHSLGSALISTSIKTSYSSISRLLFPAKYRLSSSFF